MPAVLATRGLMVSSAALGVVRACCGVLGGALKYPDACKGVSTSRYPYIPRVHTRLRAVCLHLQKTSSPVSPSLP
ncbi:hypothetical protein C8Q77DRAFT_1129374 [Trametes polyzona]|nr:hypothetical protein C8Q77DRAFT_1129374 [Trametes polyzona]